MEWNNSLIFRGKAHRIVQTLQTNSLIVFFLLRLELIPLSCVYGKYEVGASRRLARHNELTGSSKSHY